MKMFGTAMRMACGVVLAVSVGAALAAASAATRTKQSTQSHPTATIKKASVSTTSKPGTKTSSTHKKVTSKKRDSRARGQKAPTADRVTEIQEALAKNGAYPNDPSGKWDANTVDAMKKFQQANGLTPSGKMNALTLQKLGLGSDVAGRAAPRPEQSPTKR